MGVPRVTGFAGPALLTQAAAAAETVVVRQADAGLPWFTVLVGISQIIIAGAILTFVLAFVFVGVSLLRKAREKGSVIGQVLNDLIPLLRRLNRMAERMEAVAETAKASVDRVDGTVRDATDRVKRLLDGTERRVREFDALVDVARRGADDAVVGSVAALRGVREGARVLRNGRPRPSRAKVADDFEADRRDEYDDELEDDFADEFERDAEADVALDADVLEERVEHAIDVEAGLRSGGAEAGPRVRRTRMRADAPLDEEDEGDDLTATEEADDTSFERPRIRPRA